MPSESKMVDLGREYESLGCCANKDSKGKKEISYPTLYISGVNGLDLSIGEITGTFRGKVASVSERESRDGKEEYCCEIEVHAISIEDGESKEGGLEESLEKISKKKSNEKEYDEDNDE